MRKLFGAMALAFLFSVGSSACDGCKPAVDPDAGSPGVGRLVISEPLSGANITPFDDQDPSSDGINLVVRVLGENIPDGTEVKLVNSAGGTIAPVVLSDGVALFEGVTFIPGDPPDGLVNTLTASAGSYQGDSISVTVLGESQAQCQFVTPQDGDTLSDDANATQPYFQADVLIACGGSGIPADAEVVLGINGASTRTVALSAGQASFSGVTLAEGSNTLTAHTYNLSGTQVADTSIGVTVDTGACDAQITDPAAGTLNAAVADLDESTPLVLDVELTVTSTRCPAGSVSVEINGVEAGTGSLSSGSAQIQVALPQGSDSAVAKVNDSDHTEGNSLPVNYEVDSLVPAVSVSHPADGAVLGAADDEEIPANPDNGLTYSISGTIAHAAGVTATLDVLLDGVAISGSPFDLTVDPANGGFRHTLVNLIGGSYQATVYAVDGAGNSDSATVSFTVDMAVPVVTLAITSDADSNAVLNLAEDASGDTDYQVSLTASVTGVTNPSSYIADISAQQIDTNGDPVGPAIVASQTFASSGDAVVSLTLSAVGRYNFTVVARSSGGTTSEPSTDQVVVVDFIAPDLLITSPANNSVRSSSILNLLAQSSAPDFDVSSPVLDINGTPVTGAIPVVNSGTITYSGLSLSGASNGEYLLTVTIRDTAANPTSAQVRVVVDQAGPVVVLSGWANASASARHVDLSASEASPTLLHSSANPDYDYNSQAAGMQFGFHVVVSGETAETLGADPQAKLTVEGYSEPLFAPLVANGANFEAFFTENEAGISLADGPLAVSAEVSDVAGNTSTDSRAIHVQTGIYYVRIDEPSEGSSTNASSLDVVVSGSVFDGASCDLLLDGGVVDSKAINSGAVTYTGAAISGEGEHTLQVICDIGGGLTTDSQVMHFSIDTGAPTGLNFVFAGSDTAGHLPTSGFFNLSWASTGTAFERGVQVRVAAEAGACPFADPTLTVTPTSPAGSAVPYSADGTSGGHWTLAASDCVATFSNVILGQLLDAGQVSDLHLDVSDQADNASSVSTTVTVDRVAPALTQTFPGAGVTELGTAYDEDPVTVGLQMQGSKRWTFDVDDRALAGDVQLSYSGPAAGTATAAAVSGSVRIATNWAADGDYAVDVTVSDEAGNATSLGAKTYIVDTSAPALLLYDNVPALMANGISSNGPYQWAADKDVSSNLGGQFNFTVRVDGVRSPFTVRLCSDHVTGSSSTPCQDSQGVSGFVVASVQLTPTGSGLGTAAFSGVELEQGLHHLYAEADDTALNHASTFPVQVTIDTYAPRLISVSFVNNNIGNDAACSGLCINASESPSDIVVQVSSAGDNEDLLGRQLTLSSDNGGQIGVVTLAVGSAPTFSATFSNVTLNEGAHALTASLTDALGNPLDMSTGSNPGLFVDTLLPSVTGHNPPTQLQTAASILDISISIADNGSTVDGYQVSLSNTTTGAQPVLTAASGGGAAFTGFVLQDNTINNLSATVTDLVGNISSAYNFSYDVDTSAPSVALLAPTAPTNLSGSDTTPGVNDGYYTTNIFHVAIAGYNRGGGNTRVALEWRAWNTSNVYATVRDGDVVLSADSADLQFTSPDPGLPPGDLEVRARVYESDTGHESVSTSAHVTVDLGVPLVTILRSDGTSQLTSGHSFLVAEDENIAAGAYSTTLFVQSDAPVGSTVRLFVNGVQVGSDQPLPSGNVLQFSGVALDEYSVRTAGNTIRAEVVHLTSSALGSTEVTACKADGDAPTIAFDVTGPRTVLYADDSDHNATGWQAVAGSGLGFTTTGVEEAVTQAFLTCNGTDATVDPVSNAGEFVDMPGLVTSGTSYTCSLSVSDITGNQAVSANSRAITVDIDRPSIPAPVACIGENTGANGYEIDDESGAAKCSVACSGNSCSRRASDVTLTWVAPGDNGSTGANVASYVVRYLAMDITTSPSCLSMAGATTADTGAMSIVAAGQQQSFTLAGLGVHKDYCFEVTAQDARGNTSTSSLVLRRVPLLRSSVATGTSAVFGATTSASGDLDGDGQADIAIGEYAYTEDATGNRGRVVVHYSRASLADTNILYAVDHGGTRFGWAVSTGDFNGDGVDDLAIGELLALSSLGRVYLYFGSSPGGLNQAANAADGDLPSLVPDVVIEGSSTVRLGGALANRAINFDGDLNGSNRLDDLVVYGYNSRMVYVFRGRTSWTSGLTEANADLTFDFTGVSPEVVKLLTGGDFDVDGKDELVVPVDNRGSVFVVYGRALSAPLVLTPASADVFELTDTSGDGSTRYGYYATAYEGTGDAAADLAVFDWFATGAKIWFYRGTASSKVAPVANSTTIAVNAADNHPVDTLGDVTGDGIADLCIGQPGTGGVDCYAGQSTGVVTSAAAVSFPASPNLGSFVSGGGDHNGDGYMDLVVTDSAGTAEVSVLY